MGEFARAGANTITVHAEATPHLDYVLEEIRSAGCRAGLAVNPSTPPAVFGEVRVDQALCMTVNPGWGGQAFIPRSLDKIKRLRAIVGDDPDVEVDGGIDLETARPCADGGRDVVRRRNRDLRRARSRGGLRGVGLQHRV